MNASILKYLKANGEQLDSEISQALHIPMAQLKTQVAQLSASGDVICCKVTRFIEGKKIDDVIAELEGIKCPGSRTRQTSCPDQLAKALRALKENEAK